MSKRDDYVHALQAKLDEWNVDIDSLSAKAGGTAADVKKEFMEQIESLKSKREATGHKIEELQKAGDSAWEDLKSGLELSWSAMSEAIESAKTRFK